MKTHVYNAIPAPLRAKWEADSRNSRVEQTERRRDNRQRKPDRRDDRRGGSARMSNGAMVRYDRTTGGSNKKQSNSKVSWRLLTGTTWQFANTSASHLTL